MACRAGSAGTPAPAFGAMGDESRAPQPIRPSVPENILIGSLRERAEVVSEDDNSWRATLDLPSGFDGGAGDARERDRGSPSRSHVMW